MEVRRIMTTDLITAARDTPVHAITLAMHEHQIGVLPVVENGRLIGMVTDRDIVTRLMTIERGASAVTAEKIMTRGVVYCFSDQRIADAAAIMGDHQVRRLPVLDRSGRLSGLLSLGDIAENGSEQIAGEALGEIVESR